MQALRVLLLFSSLVVMETLRRRAKVMERTQDKLYSTALTISLSPLDSLGELDLDFLSELDPDELQQIVLDGIGSLDLSQDLSVVAQQYTNVALKLSSAFATALNPLFGVFSSVFWSLFGFGSTGTGPDGLAKKLVRYVDRLITQQLDAYNLKNIRSDLLEVLYWVGRVGHDRSRWETFAILIEGKFHVIFDACWFNEDSSDCKHFCTTGGGVPALMIELSFLELTITVIGQLALYGIDYKYMAQKTFKGVKIARRHLRYFEEARLKVDAGKLDMEVRESIGLSSKTGDRAGCLNWDWMQNCAGEGGCRVCKGWGEFTTGTKWEWNELNHRNYSLLWGRRGDGECDDNKRCFASYKQHLIGKIDHLRTRVRTIERSASMIMAGTDNCDLFMYVGSPFNPDLKAHYNPTNNWTAWYYANISVAYTHWLISGKQEGRKCDMPCDWRAYGEATNQPDLLKARIEYLQYGRDLDWDCRGYQLDCDWPAYQAHFKKPILAEARMFYWKWHHEDGNYWQCPNKTAAP